MDVENYNFDEGHYFDLILEYYLTNQELCVRNSELEIWKNHLILNLMKHLREGHKKELIKDVLVLLLSLFEDLPVDRYHTRGKELNQLSLMERHQIQTILKEEYTYT